MQIKVSTQHNKNMFLTHFSGLKIQEMSRFVRGFILELASGAPLHEVSSALTNCPNAETQLLEVIACIPV